MALVAAPLLATSAWAAAPAPAAAPVVAVAAAPAPGPAPYGGLLDAPDPGEDITTEQVLEVGMLALGTLNGLAVAVAILLSRLRGPSVADTRHALITRTTPGKASRNRRFRRTAAGTPGVTGPGPAPVSAPLPVPVRVPALLPGFPGLPVPAPFPARPAVSAGVRPAVPPPAVAPGAVPAQVRAGSGPIPIVAANAVRRRTSA